MAARVDGHLIHKQKCINWPQTDSKDKKSKWRRKNVYVYVEQNKDMSSDDIVDCGRWPSSLEKSNFITGTSDRGRQTAALLKKWLMSLTRRLLQYVAVVKF